MLEVGGGFPVRYDTDPPPLAEYAAAIKRARPLVCPTRCGWPANPARRSPPRGPETIRPGNSSTDWSRRSMTPENHWFGEVLASDSHCRYPGLSRMVDPVALAA